MCRRFIPIDCDEVARIAAEIERDLAAHADELASLDPIEAYEDFLFLSLIHISEPTRPY